ncbi:MAG TPA: four helix bundle protein [Holophagaceae bacterium]|nr:four helix bundle protein [Holophagaceae bacterium]
MSRDHRKLKVFQLADALAVEVYRATGGFPQEERFALQSQMRRGAVSAAANIVEGSARRSTAEYVNFLNVALGSAAEVDYLIGSALELGFLDVKTAGKLRERTPHLIPGLKGLIHALEVDEPSKSQKPKAKSPA